MSERIALYPGSFDPFHVGHLDVLKQAMQLFDKVVVIRAINPDKKPPTSKLPENFLASMNVGVSHQTGLIADYVKSWEKDGHDVTLIRGLRSGLDLSYEQNLLAFLKGMHPTIKVVFFPCDPRYQHISSSALRGIERFSQEEYRKYVIED